MNCKKLFYPVLILLFITAVLNDSNAKNIKFGIKRGLNTSDISGAKYSETKRKTGFNVYVFGEFVNLKVFSISAVNYWGNSSSNNKNYVFEFLLGVKF